MLKRSLLACLLSILSCSQPLPKGTAPDLTRQFIPAQNANLNQVTFAVVGINDFHGNLLPKERKLPNGTVIQSGGASNLTAMIKILREELQGRVLIVDAGDEWQGTLESNQSQGSTVVDFYNRLGMNVSAIGNHEFDFSVPTMLSRFSEAKYPYVASNIYVKKSGARVNWENVKPSQILDVGGVKVGVIGVSTVQTPGTTRYEFVKHLRFKNAENGVIEESAALRKKGASVVLVTAHAGTVCEDQLGLKSWKLWSEQSEQGKCDAEQEIYQLASHLPVGVLDGIVSGHTHQIIHHFFNHIPVIQDESYDQFFNVIYYTLDLKTKQVIPSLTRIEGLIPICDQVFEGTDHCDVRRLAKTENPKLTQAYFHGKAVHPDSEIEAWLAPIRARTDHYRKEVLATSELPLTHFRDREGALGNLIADIMRERGQSDFSLVNSGGIRTPLEAGPVTYDDVFRALPFDNVLNVVRLNGKQIKLLYQIATAGSHGIIGFSGLKLTLIPYDREVERVDLDGNGKLENWEGKRLVKIETSDGKPILDQKTYTVATFDFLVNGGDDLHWFMDQVSKKNIKSVGGVFCRDLLVDYLKSHSKFNTLEHPLVDPKNPRVIFSL